MALGYIIFLDATLQFHRIAPPPISKPTIILHHISKITHAPRNPVAATQTFHGPQPLIPLRTPELGCGANGAVVVVAAAAFIT